MSRVDRNQSIYEENSAKQGGSGSRAAGQVLRWIGIITMVVVISACLSLVIPKLAGYDAYVVVSGSMEPAIPVGSIVFSKETDPAQLQSGDVIVFIDPARGTTPITHRVVSNDTAAGSIITKGDANESEDIDPVTYDNVLGRVGIHIPRMGFAAATLTSVMGKVVAGLLLLEAWLLIEIGRRMIRKAG